MSEPNDDRIESVSAAPLSCSSSWRRKVLVLLVVLGGIVAGYWAFHDVLTLDYLAARESDLRQLQADHPWLVILAAIAIYVGVTGLSLPGATVLTLTYGWYFRFWHGLLITSFSSTAGATIAFLISRYLLRSWVQQRMSTRLRPINAAFEREGAYYLFTLRLIPAVPFFVINAVMGLTPIRVLTFWWVSQLGMLPGTAAYVYAGSTVPGLQTLATEGAGSIVSWKLILAFCVLGLLPLVIRRLVQVIKQSRQRDAAV